MKMSAVEARATPAEAKATHDPLPIDHWLEAKRRAIEVGIAAWKTIAPVMLPRARVSLPRRIQITLLSFSGSSVAIGAMTRAQQRLVEARPSGPAPRPRRRRRPRRR